MAGRQRGLTEAIGPVLNVPGWKVARELRRLREQAKAFVLRPFYAVLQRRYDTRRDRLVKVITGAQPLGADVVIVLVYQPNGLAASLFHTLRHIAKQGASAFVVLNAPINDTDLARLREVCALILQRPNFGYDFGGYRDALLHLFSLNQDFQTVACLNDSIWYPVFPECDHLRRMRHMDGALVGYAYAKGFRNRKIAHVQSYFFLFRGPEFLKCSDFRSFWSNLRIANSRHFTIRNSEMEMTRYFAERGHKIDWLYCADDLEAIYRTCPIHNLELMADYLVSIGHKLGPILKSAQAEGPDALRSAIIASFSEGKLSRNVIGFEPLTLFEHSGFAAMKKAAARNYIMQRRSALDLGITNKFHPAVAAEIRDLDQRIGPRSG